MNWLFGIWGSVKAFVAAGLAWLAALPLSVQAAMVAGAALVGFAIYYRKELKTKLSTSKGRREMLAWFLNALSAGLDAVLNPAEAAVKISVQLAKLGAAFVQFLEKMAPAAPAPAHC